MKRCPDCGRNYNDDSMSFCLDDGSELLFGPASIDEPATAILTVASAANAPTGAQVRTTNETAIFPGGSGEIVPKGRGFDKRLILAPIALAVILLGGFFGYRYFAHAKQIESIAVMPLVNVSGDPD